MDEAASDSADEGDIGLARMNAKRILLAELRTGNGDSAMDEANDAVRVNIVAGAPGSPSAVTIADGADVAQGTTTDAAVTSDTSGTVIGFLRGLVKIFASVWDSLNGRLKVDASAVAVPVTDNGGSLTVDGTVAATQGTSPWVVGDGGGLISVDDGGGSLTVDGTVSATQGTSPWSVTGSIASQSGTITAVSQTVTLSGLTGVGTVLIQVAGVWSGQLTVEASADGSNFDTVLPYSYFFLQDQLVGVIDRNDLYTLPAAGLATVRLTSNVWTSGTASIILRASLGSGAVYVAGMLPTGLNSIGDIAHIGTSVTPGTDATHLGKPEDGAHSSGDTGVMALAVRRTAHTPTSGSDGDYNPLQLNEYGDLKTIPSDTTATGTITALAQAVTLLLQGQSTVAVYLSGVWSGSIICLASVDGVTFDTPFYLYDLSTGVTGITLTVNGSYNGSVGGYAAVKLLGYGTWTSGTVTVVMRGTAGTPAFQGVLAYPPDIDSSALASGNVFVAAGISDADYRPHHLVVDTTGHLLPGTAAANLGKPEDAAHSDGDVGVMALTVRKDTAAATAGTDGDYQPAITDATGRTWVNTELPDAALLNDTLDTASTSLPTVGVAVMGMTQGATTLSRVKAHDQQLDARSALINGLAVNAYGYSHNLSSTVGERNRTANSADGLAGTGVPASGQMIWTGSVWKRLAGDASGNQYTTETHPVSTVSSVDFSTIADATRIITLLAANTARRGAVIANDTDQTLVVKEGSAATATSYTDLVPPGSRYVLDYPQSTTILTAYMEQIPTGRVLVTERA